MPSSELEALARDRPLSTLELHTSNDFYGHARVLKRYAGLRQATALKVAIEHGINLVDHVWDVDTLAGMPVFLCAGAERAALVQESLPDWCSAVAMGPLISYVSTGEPPAPSARTLTAFPAHSTHHVDVDYDVESFARALLEERSRYDRLVVCLYWRDIQRGLHHAYERHGLECVTAGHMYGRDFLPRLRTILAATTEVVTNEVGTHVIYAVRLGRPVWMIEQELAFAAESEEVLRRDGADAETLTNGVLMEARALFAERRSSLSREQMDFVAEVGGFGAHHDPGELRALFADAERRYRHRYAAPTRMGRRARSLARYAVGRVRGAPR